LKISSNRLNEIAAETGFRPDSLEKVIRLLDLLNQIVENKTVKDKLVLKGGTALNLFIFDIPRLSVDIDLNYIGAADLETMQTERPELEAELIGICRLAGFTVNEIPSDDHAGGKWKLSYQTAFGTASNLELDLNFMHRVTFHPVKLLDSKVVGTYQAVQIPVLDTMELAAGKLSALLTRNASRDLFDTARLSEFVEVESDEFRLMHVLYGAMNPRADWRQVGIDNIAADLKELKRKLVPVLRTKDLAAKRDDEMLIQNLIYQCREFVSPLFPLRKQEVQFIALLRDQGKVAPELLTGEPDLAERIRRHPGILRRAASAIASSDRSRSSGGAAKMNDSGDAG
jgi:predicted nucleotidyltransferase component of viral defense system